MSLLGDIISLWPLNLWTCVCLEDDKVGEGPGPPTKPEVGAKYPDADDNKESSVIDDDGSE
jgi:hypothetical protein